MSSGRASRAEQRQRTQSRILAAAQKLFAELGYDRATVRAIAAEAGTDPGLVMPIPGPKTTCLRKSPDLNRSSR